MPIEASTKPRREYHDQTLPNVRASNVMPVIIEDFVTISVAPFPPCIKPKLEKNRTIALIMLTPAKIGRNTAPAPPKRGSEVHHAAGAVNTLYATYRNTRDPKKVNTKAHVHFPLSFVFAICSLYTNSI